MSDTKQPAITERWVSFAGAATFEDMPRVAVEVTKRHILDQIGVAVGGYTTDVGRIVVEVVRDLGGKEESTVVASGDKVSCVNAAYANAKLCNLLDSDDNFYASTHIGGVPLFAALAVAERVKASGKTLLLATALGYDFCARFHIASTPLPEADGRTRILEVYGYPYNTIGAATAAAKVLGLDKQQMADAVGFAAFLAPVPMGGWWLAGARNSINKYGDLGWQAHGGVMAALLAHAGHAVDPTMSVLDGQQGFWKASGAVEFSFNAFLNGIRPNQGLGEKWFIADSGIKPYPCCRDLQRQIDGVAKIMRENDLTPDDITKVTLKVNPALLQSPVWRETAKWYDLEPEEQSMANAEFSFGYTVACVAHRIPPGPQWYAPETMRSARLIKFTKKISVEPNTGYEEVAIAAEHPVFGTYRVPSLVEVESSKGNFRETTRNLRGDYWNAEARLSDEELCEKFRNHSSAMLGADKTERLIDVVMNLDELVNLDSLVELLR